LKYSVQHRNLQDDRKTFCFSSKLFFYRKDDAVLAIDPESSDYAWISTRLCALEEMKIYTGKKTPDLLEVIRVKLERDNLMDLFVPFLLICGK
jgi:hypothetical protein